VVQTDCMMMMMMMMMIMIIITATTTEKVHNVDELRWREHVSERRWNKL
jgi:hypothetical protein